MNPASYPVDPVSLYSPVEQVIDPGFETPAIDPVLAAESEQGVVIQLGELVGKISAQHLIADIQQLRMQIQIWYGSVVNHQAGTVLGNQRYAITSKLPESVSEST